MKKNVVTKNLLPCGALSCALLGVGVLPAPAAPAQSATPRTGTSVPRSGGASTPAARPAAAPSVAITNIRIAAEVGGDKIEMADVNRLVDGIVQENPKLADNTPESQKQVKQLRDDILENMIAQRLMLQEAQRRNLMPTKEKVDEAVWDFQKSFDTPADFTKWLADEKKTTDDLRTLLARRLATEALKKALVENLSVTDVDLNNFYNEHKDEFAVPETVSVRDIHFTIPKDANDAERKKQRQKVQDILKKALDSNTDFAVLAKENSDDKPSAARGGDMGLLTRDDIVDPAYAQAVFSAPVGKVYPKIVESKLVYSQIYNKETGRLEDGTVEAPALHIIKVEDKKPGRTLTLAEVTEDIKPYVLQEKAKDVIDRTIKDLRAKTSVKKYI
jgi:parvulin-like peptidyl-prolyl isomerase